MSEKHEEITMNDFLKRYPVVMSASPSHSNPNMEEGEHHMDHFSIRLIGPEGQALDTFYSMGIGHRKVKPMNDLFPRVRSMQQLTSSWMKDFHDGGPKRLVKHTQETILANSQPVPPKAEDVLDCLAFDASGVENAESFEDWAPDYGYDADSRSAERTYNHCKEAAAKLQRMLGSRKAYELLLWNVERL